nr:hypothetical protein [Tanacetum cinerariifolium]
MANEEDHAIVADGETPTEFVLMANIENKEFYNFLCSKDYLENIIESQRSEKVNEGVGYNAVSLPATSSGRELERRLVYKDQMWQVLTNQKLSASTVTRWVTSQESAEHPEDWSYMENEEDHALVADGETPTKFALMANIKNKVFDNSLCSKDYKKNTDSLNSKINELKSELSESNTYRYSKLGVDQLEGRLVEYKEREVKYIKKIRTLEIYRESNPESIKILNNEVETLKEEKDMVDGKLARLLKSSKDLENIIESQRSEKVNEGVGYNAVPLPAADLYLSLKKDLSWTGLPKFMDDTVTDYSRPSPTVADTFVILL